MAEVAQRQLRADGTRQPRVPPPQSNEELLQAVEDLSGYHIPRVAVCEGHHAPADTFCDLYFERLSDCLWIGNRGGGKTTNSGQLHGVKGRYNPGYKSLVAGAVEKQGYRAYAEFKRFVRKLGDEVLDTLLSKTTWWHGAELEVVSGTVRGLNGPHPHLAQLDEAELTTQDPFEEFQNMAQGDSRYRRQQLLTSTRKKARGLVQRLIADNDEAEREGNEAPWPVRIFCVFETLENQPDCRSAPQNAGRPEAELCDCNTVRKGRMPDGSPRTFDKVCRGRAHRSDGFVQLEDAQKRFTQLSISTWEAQQECLRPNMEGLVHQWVREDHAIRSWNPDPALGPIFRTWDWGGTNPHAVHWHQLLNVPVDYDPEGNGNVRHFKEGSLITFDETYDETGCGYYELGLKVAARDAEWEDYGFQLPIEAEVCDPASPSAKADIKKAFKDTGRGPGTWKSFPTPKPESVRNHISWGEGDRLYYVRPMCPGMDTEYGVYSWPDKKPNRNDSEEPLKEDDHAMDGTRYLLWYLNRQGHRAPSGETPGSNRAAPRPTAPDERYEPPRTATVGGSPVASTRDGGGYAATSSTRVARKRARASVR